jgi:hypothetical protein
MPDDDLKMDLPDAVTLFDGTPFSDTWYLEVWRKVFHPRKCDRCGVVKDTLGAFIGGTTKYANYLLFGYRQEIVEKMLIALRLDTYCEECFNKLAYNGSGPPPKLSELRAMRKRRETDGR